MKILFITPYDNNYRSKSAFTKSLSYMPLTMPYLAALTPKEYDAEFKAIDEGVSCFFLPWNSQEQALGEHHPANAKYVFFTERRDFPLNIRDDWTEVTIGMDKGKGTFSVIMEKRERIIDNTGGGGVWIVARSKHGEKILLLPPEYDLEDVNNILFIKKELEK